MGTAFLAEGNSVCRNTEVWEIWGVLGSEYSWVTTQDKEGEERKDLAWGTKKKIKP